MDTQIDYRIQQARRRVDALKTAEEVWRCELATHTYTLAVDVEATRAATAPDLIHIATDGSFAGRDQYLDMVGEAGGHHRVAGCHVGGLRDDV